MQDLPGAPGTARQGPTRIIMLVNDGGNATQPRAPGHERPRAAPHAARHGRLSAATRAPGADVPPTTTAGAPGQYCLSAALQAPGHGRPLAITAGVPCRDRLSAAPRAPGDDAALAATAMPPSHHRPSAAPIATVALPAGQHRLRQEGLPRVPANPRTPIQMPAHRDTAHNRAAYTHTSANPQSRSTVSSLRRKPQSSPRPPAGRRLAPSPGACSGGGLGRGPLTAHHTTHQAHPAIPSTAPRAVLLRRAYGLPQPAPPPRPAAAARRKPIRASRRTPPLPAGEGRGEGRRAPTLCSLRALWLNTPSERGSWEGPPRPYTPSDCLNSLHH